MFANNVLLGSVLMSGKINKSTSVETEIYHWLFEEVPRKLGAKDQLLYLVIETKRKKSELYNVLNSKRLLFYLSKPKCDI